MKLFEKSLKFENALSQRLGEKEKLDQSNWREFISLEVSEIAYFVNFV